MSETPVSPSGQNEGDQNMIPANPQRQPRGLQNRRKANNEYNEVQGWYMVALVFLTNFLVLGFFKSLGMLTKILSWEFGATMHVYILMCITYSLNCVAGPLACYLTRRYSAKCIALIGTSLVSLGLILSWLARSLTFLYVSMGVLVGLGSGLAYPTGAILVGNYFVGTKGAGLANALIVSGSPIGGMIMPYVISALCEQYSSRGAFLIVGGLMLHSILCARAYTPPPSEVLESDPSEASINIPIHSCAGLYNEQNTAIHPAKLETVVEKADETFHNAPRDICSTGILKIYERDDDIECRKRASGTSIDCRDKQTEFLTSSTVPPKISRESRTKSVFLQGTGQQVTGRKIEEIPEEEESGSHDNSNANVYFRQFGNACEKCREKSRMVTSLHGLDCYKKCLLGGERESKGSVQSLGGGMGRLPLETAPVNNNLRRLNYVATTAGTGSRPYILALDHSCLILCSDTDLTQERIPPIKEDQINNNYTSQFGHASGDGGGERGEVSDLEKTEDPRGCLQKLKEWVATSPLRNPIYVFLLLSNSSTAFSSANISLMVSQLVEETSDDYSKSSIVYLLISLADLTGRLLGAFLSDKNIISPAIIYAMGLLFSGASSSVFAMLENFNQFCIAAVIFGLFTGFQVGIYGFLLTNIVGREKIHVGYGISMFLNGTIQCFAILIIGRTISNYTDCFPWLAPLLGSVLAFGGVVWICGLLLCNNWLSSLRQATSECERSDLQNAVAQDDNNPNVNVRIDSDSR